jgi:hypothetical protein
MADKININPETFIHMDTKLDSFLEFINKTAATKTKGGVKGAVQLFDPNNPDYPEDFAAQVADLINSSLFGTPVRTKPPLVYVGPPDEKGNVTYLDPSTAQRLMLENILAGRQWMDNLALVEFNNQTMPARYKIAWTEATIDIRSFAAKVLNSRRGIEDVIKEVKTKYERLMVDEKLLKIPISTISPSEYKNVEDTWSRYFEKWWREQTSPENIENFKGANNANINKFTSNFGRRVAFHGDVPGSNGVKFLIWSKARIPSADKFQYEDVILGQDIKNNAVNVVENWAEIPWSIPDNVLDQLNQVITSEIGHYQGVENQKAQAQIKNLEGLTELISAKIASIDSVFTFRNSTVSVQERQELARATLDMVTRKLAILKDNFELGEINDNLFFSLKTLYAENSLGMDTETYLEALRQLKRDGGFNISLFIQTKLQEKNPEQEVVTYDFGIALDIGKDRLFTVESRLSNKLKAIFGKYQAAISSNIATQKHSPSFLQKVIASFLSKSFPGQKNKLKKYLTRGGTRELGKGHRRIKSQVIPIVGSSTKVSKSTKKKLKRYYQKRKLGFAQKFSGGAGTTRNMPSLIATLNEGINEAVTAQMTGGRTLQWDSGRFANSVQITNIDAATKSIMYKYLSKKQAPYDIFSQDRGKNPWNKYPERDPNIIIDKAIRSMGDRYVGILGADIKTMRGG